MKKEYSFANAKPVNLGKIDYWRRIGLFGYKPARTSNLKELRKFMESFRKDRKEMDKMI